QSPSRPPVDALGRPICPTTLFGIRAEGLHDGNGQGVFRVRSSILPAAASKLEEPNMDAKEPLVRTCGNSRAAEGRAKNDLTAGWQSRLARCIGCTSGGTQSYEVCIYQRRGTVYLLLFSSSPRSHGLARVQIIALPELAARGRGR